MKKYPRKVTKAIVYGLDGTVLLVDSADEVYRLVSEFRKVCEKRNLKVIVQMSIIMRCSTTNGNGPLRRTLNALELKKGR